MVVLYFQAVGYAQVPILSLDVPDDLPISEVCNSLAEREGFLPGSVHLVLNLELLTPSNPASTINSTERNPIKFVGKDPSAPSPPPARPRTARPIYREPFQPPGGPLSDESIQAIVDMGFPEDATRTAIQLCEGSVEIAAELLISGNVSIEGLRAIVPPVADGIPATASDIPGLLPLVVENGDMLTLLSQGSASITRSDGVQFSVNSM
jgi:hypothetical protein